MPEPAPDLAAQLARARELLEQQGADLKEVVRATVRGFAAAHPGRSVEVRIPPYVAVQCVDGPRHTRGTPPNVVETDARTWLELCLGAVTWAQARRDGRVHASGERADLSGLLPIG